MRIAAVFLVSMLLASVFIPCASVAAQLSQIPHEDPSAIQGTLDSYSFLSQYAQIFQLAASKQYQNASQLNEQLSHITVPDNLRYIINRYSNLTQQLISVLQQLDGTLNNASTLIDQNRLTEASESLNQAGVLVSQVQIILGELNDATSTMSRSLGVFSSAIGSQVQDAYKTLQTMLERLQALIDQYHQLLTKTNQAAEEIKNYRPTTITLSLNETSCFVGAQFTVVGTLTANGGTLNNREIDLYINNQKIASTLTDVNGTYTALLKVPYKYVDTVSVKAIFIAQGNDKDQYLGSSSQNIQLKVKFYRTILQASTPSTAYPGRVLVVDGNVTVQDSSQLSNRQVSLLLDNNVRGQAIIQSNGNFEVTALIPSQIQLGSHSLKVIVDPSGLYAGASLQRDITIQKINSTIQVNAPTVIILPSSLQISGSVDSASSPLADANVQIEFANATVNTKSLGDGSFSVTLNVPFNTVFIGNQDLNVTVLPNEPWQAGAQQTAGILVFNSVSIGIAVSSFLVIVLVMYFRFASPRSKKIEKIVETTETFAMPVEEKPDVVKEITIGQIKLEGLRGKIITAYTEALNAVQSVTSESLMPNMTLREYLQTTKTKLGDACEPFSELTQLTEKSLYSTKDPSESEIQTAENYANDVRRIINGRTA